MRWIISFILLSIALSSLAHAQSGVRQYGNVTAGHVTAWSANGVVKDGGSAASSALTSLGTTASGPSICATSDLTSAAAYQRICIGATTADGGQISVQNFGTAAPKSLNFNINGVSVDVAAINGITVATTPINSGISGRVLYDNAGVLGELGTVGSGSVVLASAASTTVNGQSCALGSTCTITTSSNLTVGSSVIASGTTTRVLYDNAGILGEYGVSGTGSVCMTTSCTMVTPILGAAAATSINFGGATLSTYTTGTWTPTLIGSSTAGTGQTYSGQTGSYEIVGRQVVARFNLIVTAIGTAAGNALIGGLPVAQANVSAGEQGYCFVSNYQVTGLAASNVGVMGIIANNTSQVELHSGANASSPTVTLTQTGGTPFFQGTCIYRAS